MLALYARAFPTVEVDATFFSIPASRVVAAWRQDVPPDFLFALKVPQEITHERRLVDVDQRLARFLNRVAALEDQLGPLLIQLSPDFRANQGTREILSRFVDSLSSDFRWAIEFRQPQWLTSEVLEQLRRRNVAVALTDGRWIKRGLMLDLALEPTADFGYVRWTSPLAPRKTPLGAEPPDRTPELGAWATALRPLAERVNAIHGYFSNHFQGHGPASARAMQQLVGEHSVDPSMLREQAELF